ncbi:MAG: hypothetical protein WA981_00410 [Glaciecola sp.]
MTKETKLTTRRKILTAMGLGMTSGAVLASSSNSSLPNLPNNTQFAYAKDYQVSNSLNDDTHALQQLCEHAIKNNKVAVLESKKYYISASLLSSSTYKNFSITCLNGQAEIEIVGENIEAVFDLHNLQSITITNLSINANHNVATALELRRNDDDINGYSHVHIDRVKIINCFRSTQSKAAAGIMIIGAFDAVNIHSCHISDIGRKSENSESTGIAVVQTNGVVNIQNCLVQNITTPDDKDADGVKIFARNMQNIAQKLGAQVTISNCRFVDCKGRSIKLQITDSYIYANIFELNDNFSTITNGSFIDSQADNGNINNNSFYIHDAELGDGFACISFQNIRNTSGKGSFCSHNFIQTNCVLPYFVMAFSKFKTSQVIVESNIIEGVGCNRFLLHRLYDTNTTDFTYLRVALINNSITFNTKNDKACLYYDWNHAVHDNTLLLQITGNTCTNHSRIGRIFIDQKGFNGGSNFLISNNINFDNMVTWRFNLNNLPAGNDIIATNNEILSDEYDNYSPFHIITSNFKQQITFDATDKVLTRKKNMSKLDWKDWVLK